MNTSIKLLDNQQLTALCKEGKITPNTVIIDVREPSEYQREHIPGSINVPLASLAKTDFSKYKDKIAIFHCKLGTRTRSSQDILQRTGFNEIYCMQGGIEQWKQCNLPTAIDYSAPIDIMRQVQIIAGSLVLIGVILSYFIAPAFIILSGIVGAGLLFAGITGFCGMARLLMFMPWNKGNKHSDCHQ